jgi:hypothetical protein
VLRSGIMYEIERSTNGASPKPLFVDQRSETIAIGVGPELE